MFSLKHRHEKNVKKKTNVCLRLVAYDHELALTLMELSLATADHLAQLVEYQITGRSWVQTPAGPTHRVFK